MSRVEESDAVLAPAMRLLDAMFAELQSEQKACERRYLVITELRGAIGRLARGGADVALHRDGAGLVLRVGGVGQEGPAFKVDPPAGLRPVGGDQVSPVRAALDKAERSSKRGGNWLGMWSPEEDARLIQLVAGKMRAGERKMQAVHGAGIEMGRSAKSCESRLFNRLFNVLEAELVRDPVSPGMVPISQKAARKLQAGIAKGWSDGECSKLVQLVADGICAGQPKGVAVAAAAVALSRPFHGAQFRILNHQREALRSELARRDAADVGPASVKAAAAHRPVLAKPVGAKTAVVKPVVAKPVVAKTAAGVPSAARPVVRKPIDPNSGAVVSRAIRSVPAAKLAAAPPVAPPPVRRVAPPRSSGRSSQVAAPDDLSDLRAHLLGVTKGDADLIRRDFAILHLACAGFQMGEIALDLGLDPRAVKERFEVLCGYDPISKKGRFLRSHVFDAIEAMLTPKAVSA